MKLLTTTSLAVALVATATYADTVEVVVTGSVECNQITFGEFAAVSSGDPATLTFTVDSDVFTDSPNFPTRGYDIDQSSFVLEIGSVTIGLEDPFPGGVTPYLVIRDNDPGVDGFLVSTNIEFPFGVPIDEPGVFGAFINNYYVTYTGDTLPSLDILDALGTYDFTSLTVFNWTIDDGPFQPLILVFEEMTISLVSDCVGDITGDGFVGVPDLLAVLTNWGPGGGGGPADVNNDGTVDTLDLLDVLTNWGPCR